MTLRLKIILILVFSALVGDAAIYGVWKPWQQAHELDRLQQESRDHLTTLGDAITPFLLQNQLAAAHETLDATLERVPEWQRLLLLGPEGQVLYPLGGTEQAAAANEIRIEQLVSLRNQTLARLVLVVDTQPVRTGIEQQALILLAFVSFGFLLSGLIVGLLLNVLVGKRTTALISAVEGFARGDESAKLPPGPLDELGRLTAAFAQMRQQIQLRNLQLMEARDLAEASNRAKSSFLASMSHELRTPLNAILGFSQLLRLDPNLPGGINAQVGEIQSAGEHLLALVNDVIDLSRIEAGRLELCLEAVHVQAVLRECQSIITPLAQKAGVELLIPSGAPGAMVMADYLRLRQVLINLLSNAVKYNKPQGNVALEFVPGDGRLRFTVSDNGLGIPADKQARIFNAFDRLGREAGSVEGTGIGLMITRRLVEAMGGAIGFSSVEGEGSSFWFELPLASASDGRASAKDG